MSRRLNRIQLSHSDQLLYCRLIDRRAALSDRGPRRSRRRRQQPLPHGTQITPSTVTCQSACAEAEDRPSRGGALRSSFREPHSLSQRCATRFGNPTGGGSREYRGPEPGQKNPSNLLTALRKRAKHWHRLVEEAILPFRVAEVGQRLRHGWGRPVRQPLLEGVQWRRSNRR